MKIFTGLNHQIQGGFIKTILSEWTVELGWPEKLMTSEDLGIASIDSFLKTSSNEEIISNLEEMLRE